MNKWKLSVVFAILISCFTPGVTAQTTTGTEIDVSDNSTHIARITKDTIVVISGSTYSFTVDTPEDKGLVSTGMEAEQLFRQIRSKDGSLQKYKVLSGDGLPRVRGNIATGDRLVVTPEGKPGPDKTYYIAVEKRALSGRLRLEQNEITVNTTRDLTLLYSVGQRSPNATVKIYFPEGIKIGMDNTTVNVIGRGDIKLRDLERQSIGRVGADYPYLKVGKATITEEKSKGSVLSIENLDLRPSNGTDLKIVIRDVSLPKTGSYVFRATYTTSLPEILSSPGTGPEITQLKAVKTISDLRKVLNKNTPYRESPEAYTSVNLTWTPGNSHDRTTLMQSVDTGKTWAPFQIKPDVQHSAFAVSGLKPNKLYAFRLFVENGENRGSSNTVYFYSGKMDIKQFGASGNGDRDDTETINKAVTYLNRIGGGTLLFSEGTYHVRTVHLKSNVWLYLDKGATIKAIKGADAPENTWFSDKQYRSGLSPTDTGPYINPENWLTKQDVGHTFFRNTMFFGERLDNVKIIGTGRITGNGNLVTSDKVMDRSPDNRADKMFTFKLCTNLEIGGLYRTEDLWYDAEKDEPYYIGKDGAKSFRTDNMLHIDQAGHFALLATGTDNIYVHNTYFAKNNGANARDIYDFMGCNRVTVKNIYSRVSSDDIVKLGSDCSLGFTRPSSQFMVRNIIGDTNCNLFQIGSETADDIKDVHVDNIYVLGANKAGFSISSNDGGHVKDVHLNCGHTGTVHSRSKMYRTRAPFFISISNRARVLGARVGRYRFNENGIQHDELLATNVNIGQVENIVLRGVDIREVYGGSSFRNRNDRWPAYNGSQYKATPIVAGYKLPDPDTVEGGLDFKLPDGKHTGHIKNIEFTDIHLLVKGGNPVSDIKNIPPELGVGQYNISNLGIQPSYGLWARHTERLTIKKSSFNYEKQDGRFALFLDDVADARISDVKMVRAKNNRHVIQSRNSSGITLENILYYEDTWGNSPVKLPQAHYTGGNDTTISIPDQE
ncbi:endopygalactorunase [Sinomicrobium weinanense]|uniref:Endopygalactorunase n=1 Tax=Sinomicrobium weinanense TaxID=2842200 RepID=A0A926Q3W5_9FLAO|nr:endopygalactorunase [Sinomicrobium weinanense]MBC9797993.1 endopygalactorunase [Sinomicrobium weinanense]MBU3125584.1 hypothetical protein [Sinomicrobium weinanense]